jgi:hypothetical protein
VSSQRQSEALATSKSVSKFEIPSLRLDKVQELSPFNSAREINSARSLNTKDSEIKHLLVSKKDQLASCLKLINLQAHLEVQKRETSHKISTLQIDLEKEKIKTNKKA